MISYRHKFIFIHIYKVAGTSIAQALFPYAFHNPFEPLINGLKNRLNLEIIVPFYKYRVLPLHIKARELKDQLPPEIFDKFFKFAFVRNTWDWQVSLYFFMRQTPFHKQHDLIAPMTFDEYIEWRVIEDRKLQKEFVVDEDGQQIVNFIGRYERLSEDFQHVCDVLGLHAALPHMNKSSRRDYRTYYNERTRRLVEEHFKEDIDFFGFTFDGGVYR
jgi:hypothetical protein